MSFFDLFLDKTTKHLNYTRQQLNEQLRCLDLRQEATLAMLGELQEFYREKARLEIEYSKVLDRLVKNVMLRHKAEKNKRELWPGYSTYTCWQTLLASTKRQSKDHSVLGDIYQNQLVPRLSDLMDDVQRIYRRCRDIGVQSHEELLKVLSELQNGMKTYQTYHSESRAAEVKLRQAESQRLKAESGGTLSKKFRNMEKIQEKKQAKYTEHKIKSLKARNEYLLALSSCNAAVKRYFVDDMPDLIDCIDCGYHNTLARAMLLHVSCESNVINSRKACVDLMNKCISDLDQGTDKQRFLELHCQHFSLPKEFEFQPHKGDEVKQVSAQKVIQDEMLDRCSALNERIGSLKLSSAENWKTLESIENRLMEQINVKDYEVSHMFNDETSSVAPPQSPHDVSKKRTGRVETETYYIQKFGDFILKNNMMTRLQAKLNCLERALGEGGASAPGVRPPTLPPKPKKRRVLARSPLQDGQRPKLFGGSIEEYIDVTGDPIPLVIRSCVRVINLHGMQHQGVFRVSGSQHEILELKNGFEKGEDPLFDCISADSQDINSVAGVLKLYFRELREPLFPTQLFDQLISCTRLEESSAKVRKIKELISVIPRCVVVVMRYIFAFLNHVTEYSDENMMDPYNLAICFGPTLLPIPPDRDQVTYHSPVNDLVKTILQHNAEIFSSELEGPIYERLVIEDAISERDSLDNLSDNEYGDYLASEDELEPIEAEALYDFTGRTSREITFHKGDLLLLFSRVSDDWWQGTCNGQNGVVPDKYIRTKSRRESTAENRRRSTESLPTQVFLGQLSVAQDPLDKSLSQPNILMSASCHGDLPSGPMEESDTSSVNSSSAGTQSSSSRDTLDEPFPSPLSPPLSAASMATDVLKSNLYQPADLDRSNADLSNDIASALAEVMSSLSSLGVENDGASSITNAKAPKEEICGKADNDEIVLGSVMPRHTPDLVLDLPVNQSTHSPTNHSASSSKSNSPMALSTAEVFADEHVSTIKKAASLPKGIAPTDRDVTPQPVECDADRRDVLRRSTPHDVIQRRGAEATGQPLSLPIMYQSGQRPLENRTVTTNPNRSLEHQLSSQRRSTGSDVIEQVELVTPVEQRQVVMPSRSPRPFPTVLHDDRSAPTSMSPPDSFSAPPGGAAAGRPKPPVKAKPSIMKKPTYSPEVTSNRTYSPPGSCSPHTPSEV